MEFVIRKTDLVRELQTITGVVEKRATLPILANLLLETRPDGIRVGASDLEVTVRGKAPAEVKQEGSVTLPAGKLHEIARSLPEADVQFKLLERNQMSITCQRTRYRIPGQPRDDFPKFPELDLTKGMKLPGSALREMIERVSFAITTEDPRYSLNGALFLIEEGKASLVATDGHRLAFVSREADLSPPGEVRLIVPRKALAEVSKMTMDLDSGEPVAFGSEGNHVFFQVGDHVLTTTTLEGNFPRYENVMPEACETQVVLPTAALADAVRRVSLVSADRHSRAVRLALSSGGIELSCETEMGQAEEALGVDYEGDGMEIGFNARYLLDFLGAVGTESVRLELNPVRGGEDQKGLGPGDRPGMLRPEPAGELDYRYVVMPMHL